MGRTESVRTGGGPDLDAARSGVPGAQARTHPDATIPVHPPVFPDRWTRPPRRSAGAPCPPDHQSHRATGV